MSSLPWALCEKCFTSAVDGTTAISVKEVEGVFDVKDLLYLKARPDVDRWVEVEFGGPYVDSDLSATVAH